jgi:hypothetical protein
MGEEGSSEMNREPGSRGEVFLARFARYFFFFAPASRLPVHFIGI